jgi:hypothetical protein
MGEQEDSELTIKELAQRVEALEGVLSNYGLPYYADTVSYSYNIGVIGMGDTADRPTTGEHTKGELYMDSEGALFVWCTGKGTPGTWEKVTTTAV